MEEKFREHIEKIVPLTDDEFAFVFSHFTIKSYQKPEFLIQKGKSVKYSYFVVFGLLMLVYNDDLEMQHVVLLRWKPGGKVIFWPITPELKRQCHCNALKTPMCSVFRCKTTCVSVSHLQSTIFL